MSLTIAPVNLYNVHVKTVLGVVGSFRVAAIDRDQAKLVGEEWSRRHQFDQAVVTVSPAPSLNAHPTYAITSA